MREKKKREAKISFWAAHATTIVTVTMVLLIVGLILLTAFSAKQETRRIKESFEISVIMADSISDSNAAAIASQMKKMPFCRNIELISKKHAMEIWKKDTGEDLESLFGVNPLSPEISFTIPEAYSRKDSILKIQKTLLAIKGIESVATPDSEIVSSMNTNIARLTIILGSIALVMLIISFVLINNTVHLTIHSRRFLIHTMQLVGATNGFIRRPIVIRNLYAGLFSGVLASILLAAAFWGAPEMGYNEIQTYITPEILGITALILIILGGLICSISALIATSRYLRKDYHQLILAG